MREGRRPRPLPTTARPTWGSTFCRFTGHRLGVSQIALHDVDVVFPGENGELHRGLDGMELEVDAGEMVTVVGPSGAGKSTLLRAIAGLQSIAKGSLLLDGKPIHEIPARARDVAMTFQPPALFPHLNVEDNLALGLRLRGVARREIRGAVQAIAERMGLVDLMRRRPEELSGGEKQRVALGRALVCRPKVLLLDEPFTGLDAPLRRRLIADLVAFHQGSGISVLYVTHEQPEALTLGCRIVLLREGRVEQAGVPEALYRRPDTRFAASFFGYPPMNMISGEAGLVAGQPIFRAGGNSRVLPLRGDLADVAQVPIRPAILGVRPEDLQIDPEGVWDGRVVDREFAGASGWVRLEGWAGSMWVGGNDAPAEPVGAGVRVSPVAGRMLLFDPESGRRWRR